MQIARPLRAMLTTIVALLAFALPAAGASAADDYTVETMHFDVVVGPSDDIHCDVVGDLYKPNDASAAHPDPAILTTNGFGGSKDDQAGAAKYAASHGYVVLSYSGLGFGGSGCKIYLDDPQYDGKAAKQLVTFLGKQHYVVHDSVGSNARAYKNDPRVGMVGGSYGGQIQFAAASVDPRIDTIIPIITWNDLVYSLAPNNANTDHGVTSYVPGAEKFEWTSLFFGLGIADGITGAQADPSRNVGCPNFDDRACAAKLQMDATGGPNDATMAFARHASVASYMNRIHIPTMLMQGQTDTLFNLNESVATYQALRSQGVPAKLVWQSWGHSGGGVDGEFDLSDPNSNVEGRMVMDWFNHYLKGRGPTPRLDFSYFRDWVPYEGDASPAYARTGSYPAAKARTLFASSDGTLTNDRHSVTDGSQTLVTPAAGAPTSYTETSALDQSQPVTDVPGTTVTFTSEPLESDTDVVGIPKVHVQLAAPVHEISGQAGYAGEVVLFFRLQDIAPNGDVTLTHRLIAPVRTPIPQDVHVQLPGIVHRFPAGHQIQLVVAGGDAAYRGNNVAAPVSVKTSGAHPGVLHLPIVPAGDQRPIR